MESKQQPIDFTKIFELISSNWKFILKVAVISMIVAGIFVFSLPRSYTATIKLAPEVSTGSSLSGNLSSLASAVGVNLMNGSEDAIYPEIYPDIVSSTQFLVGLFNVHVESADSSISTDLFTYLTQHQKKAWWSFIIRFIKKIKKSLSPSQPNYGIDENFVDPFWLSKTQNEVCMAINACIDCQVDKKTSVITLNYTAQDPLVAASMVDSIKVKLQNFIIDYRTQKSRNDLNYIEKLCEDAKQDYNRAQRNYARYCDSHKGTIMQAYISEQEKLENELSIAVNAYTQLSQQVQMAKAKVQERTPSFTVITNATVPQKPSRPKRLITVVAFFIMGALGALGYKFFRTKNDDLVTTESEK